MTTNSPNSEIPAAAVLIVDDEQDHAEVMGEALRRLGHVCTLVHELEAAEQELRHGQFDLIVTDLVMDNPDDGQKVLALARQHQPHAETIMVTAHGDVPTAKAAIRGGAYDFIEKPLDLDVFRTLCQHALQTVSLRAANTELRQQIDDRFGLEGIIGNSPAMRQVLATIRQVAPSKISVLVTGESGTGKELVARAIHANSPRSRKAFKPVNCAGLSASILESELFGHVRGAFTGAERDRQGVFEYADGGTLFLDEIGDMPMDMQAKLLRVLESGEYVRVGANEPQRADVRLISATNHDLPKLQSEGKFREDLFYRIQGAQIHIPALRERREDIPPIVSHYLEQFAGQLEKPGLDIADDALNLLVRYDWPGNVRQLINVIQKMALSCENHMIEPRDVPYEVRQPQDGSEEDGASTIGSLTGLSLDQIEKQAIRNALRVSAGNREQAAQMLGIGERTLYRKLKEYGLK